MDYYKITLEALYKLLDETGVTFWADWILKDIKLWEQNRSTEHHLSAYGGMGSFNDLVICTQNKHNVTKEQEPWVNTLLIYLQSLSTFLAKSKDRDITISSIANKLQCNSSQIQGTRCLSCGYAELTLTNVDSFIAPKIVSEGIVKSLKNENLIEFIGDVIMVNLKQIEFQRKKIIKIINSSGINYTSLSRWMRPCPKCGSEDTAVYRWDKVKRKSILFNKKYKFEPSDDNLSLSRK